jgi:hypothetical protein
MTATMSSTDFASTMTLGCETTFPNQFVTVLEAMDSLLSDRRFDGDILIVLGSMPAFQGERKNERG